MEFYADVRRISKALERIANAMEQSVYGVTGPEVAAAKADLQTRVERVSTAAERGSAEAAE